jgi:hypothetical protein
LPESSAADWRPGRPLAQTLEEILEEFKTRTALKCTDRGSIVGSVRAFVEEGTCHIGKLIVHP